MGAIIRVAGALRTRVARLGHEVRVSDRTRRLSRTGAAIMSVVGTLLVALALGGVTGASANAANPAPTTTGSATINPTTGAVAVDLSGTWTWPGQSCAGRYGTGWAVDWWGISSSPTPANNFSLTDASEVNPPGTTTTGTLSFAGDIPIKGGTYFHVPQYYDGETVNSPSTCTDTGSGGSATSSGSWSATATYPSVSDVPTKLCVIMYDEHGNEGKISGNANDFSTTKDGDNSIQTNAFNPAVGAGYCLSPNFIPSLSVVKTGPATGTANGNGTYTLTVSNSGTGPATNAVVTDSLPTGETFVSSSNTTCAPITGGTPVTGTSPGNSQNLSCTIASLAAGANTSFTVTVRYAADASGTLTDCATVNGQLVPSCVPTNFPSVSVVKSGPATGTANGNGVYTLMVSNSGTGAATNVVVTDSLPVGETFVSSSNAPWTLSTSGTAVPGTGPGNSQNVSWTISSLAAGASTSFTVTVSYAANPSGTLTDCATVNGQLVPSCVPTIFQGIAGDIYLCSNGSATTTEVPGGTLSATGPQAIGTAANPLSESGVATGTNTMSATAPSGYEFVSCGGSATIGSPTTATESVTVPSGGTGHGIFYVTQSTGQIAGDIYLCSSSGTPTTTLAPGGSFGLSLGGTPIVGFPNGNPLAPMTVQAGNWLMSAGAPSGYTFVTCTGSATIGSPPTSAAEMVNVPVNGLGTGIFYVVPVPSTGQLAGHIYLCTSGSPTVTEVPGGMLSATGPSTVASTGNPLGPTTVNAGAYTMSATAPSGYTFVACLGTAAVGLPPTTATEGVTVPQNGTGTGVFYVVPTGTITLSVTKANDANGSGVYQQTETAQTLGEDVGFQVTVTNPSTVLSVKIISLSDSWPGQNPFSPTCSSALVGTILAPGASATCDFTATAYAPTTPGASLTDTVLVGGCQADNTANCGSATATSTVLTLGIAPSGSITLQVTKTNDANGSGIYAQTETAQKAGEDVPFQVMVTNTSTVAVTLQSLTDAWPGQSAFSPACAATLQGVTLQPGSSATCDFTVANYAPASAALTDTVTVGGCQASNAANCGSWSATSTVDPPAPVTAASSGLAFTGPPSGLHLMIEVGLSLASVGFFVLWFARPRRKALGQR